VEEDWGRVVRLCRESVVPLRFFFGASPTGIGPTSSSSRGKFQLKKRS
jgi:hypothetical protein